MVAGVKDFHCGGFTRGVQEVYDGTNSRACLIMSIIIHNSKLKFLNDTDL